MKVLSLSLALLPLLTAASPVVLDSQIDAVIDSIHHEAAPILSSVTSDEVPNSYMVVLKKHVSPEAAVKHHCWVQDIHEESERLRKRSFPDLENAFFQGLKHKFTLGESLVGYSGHFSNDVIEQVRRNPDVSYISPSFGHLNKSC